MIIGVLKEPVPEKRVSLLPEHIAGFTKLNCKVFIERGAGNNACTSDENYLQSGANIVSREEVLEQAQIILSINALNDDALKQCKAKILLGTYNALLNTAVIQKCAAANFSVFSMEMLPRTTRAQSMDVLSSQANIAGYKAVLLAANLYPKYFPMFMTAAGTIPPAKVLVLGAGVAGLQAIATAKRLGAVIEVFDTRPAVKEEVMSLGGKFIEVEGAADASKAGGYAVEQSQDFLQRQKEKIAESVAKADIIITTAQIPGKKAPVLISNEMLAAMKNGSVIVDLAAATGGNTAQTQNEKTIVYHGITIAGNSLLAGDMPADASKLYGKNILNFLQLIIDKEGNLNLNFEDDLVKGTCVAHEGRITNEKLLNL
ncbi:MAG: Re/Si-specific NAD(P)(+) transhydrogenase subunit alpha [Chitinophagaceae bacterium]|jgi:NAD(P) transhydrogenase subunit alpha|nr:Re/Si-specific NAD(P)(+) transhydrogenase subunit alpha [Chitinophagaceae bacterium]MBP6046819.1 Re/Si-specific NAD(P)(+) transhydrogenase subunit alpha [Ferruginibacter sp.]NMD28239.1 Re/Si-specific NAD(P)(+) transhydrogenase subunit alpha [Bacteroidota bacterium]MBK7087765.1 Re/Si-specific NAD(P)(+) transhydrogenase subunit alpha [Chitinophagaceae bacterium]MBK7346527.1 Re/Si-specific NAD(P)(+) transhydrogenase subunit alpha [Chitinophagaceae bacterium]